ncbi:MAG: methyltransferase domain-containing protein [Dokdonia sp.]|nr:methyltransferase domain-containing protein [Dokdonia sp.]
MNTIPITHINHFNENEHATPESIQHFYNEATEDYTFWSKDFNMHFGYCTFGKTNPLRRDTMLNEMNRQIMLRLQLPQIPNMVADLGCGMGGTMRYIMDQNPQTSMIGVTLSDFQVREGNRRLLKHPGVIIKENFCQTSLLNESQNGAIAIESFCHTGHSYNTLKEAHRILKKGSSLVIADAFLKKDPEELCLGSAYSYDGLCKGWSLDGLGVISEVEEHLKNIGFSKVKIEDVSMKVAPSVLHVPFAIPGFILKQLLRGKGIKKQSWNNLKASFYALTAGLHRKAFGYYIITATK